MRFDTVCARHEHQIIEGVHASNTPIFPSSYFSFPTCERRALAWSLLADDWSGSDFHYSRISNPTVTAVEAKLASLEGGERAKCFSSGMAAISAAVLSCIKAGDHVVVTDSVYGPTRELMENYLSRFSVTVTFAEGCIANEFIKAVQPNTRLFYIESPSSIVCRQQDIAGICSFARANDITTICDNTWATPYFQNPIEHGVDLVVHSATKYLSGHSDLLAGVVIGQEHRIQAIQHEESRLLGSVLDPFAAWLLSRGLRVLTLRMDRHQANGHRLAQLLSSHPRVDEVYYPGYSRDAYSEQNGHYLKGKSGLLSFRLNESGREPAYRVVNALSLFRIGGSWGGSESLALPLTIREGGHVAWVIRLSAGLENADDLCKDLAAALDHDDYEITNYSEGVDELTKRVVRTAVEGHIDTECFSPVSRHRLQPDVIARMTGMLQPLGSLVSMDLLSVRTAQWGQTYRYEVQFSQMSVVFSFDITQERIANITVER